MSDEDLFDIFLEPTEVPSTVGTASKVSTAEFLESEKALTLQLSNHETLSVSIAMNSQKDSPSHFPTTLVNLNTGIDVPSKEKPLESGCSSPLTSSTSFRSVSVLPPSLAPLSSMDDVAARPSPGKPKHMDCSSLSTSTSPAVSVTPVLSPWTRCASSAVSSPPIFPVKPSSMVKAGSASREVSSPTENGCEGGLSIIRPRIPASRLAMLAAITEEGDELLMTEGEGHSSLEHRREDAVDPKEIRRERYSGIAVRRITRSFLQLAVLAAEYPFISFHAIHQACALSSAGSMTPSSSFPLERMCIGVVCRKSDPKKSAKEGGPPYAVVTLWNMDQKDLSPTPASEVAFLLCGQAFQRTYSQLCLGQVLAIHTLILLSSSSGGAAPPSGVEDSHSSRSSLLLRLDNPQSVRFLGMAAELSGCEARVHTTGERCKNLVHKGISSFCKYHLKQKVFSKSGTSVGERSGSGIAATKRTTVTPFHGPGVHVQGGGAMPATVGAGGATGRGSRIRGSSSMLLRPGQSMATHTVPSSSLLPPSPVTPTATARLAVAPRRLPTTLSVPFLTVTGRSGVPSTTYGDGTRERRNMERRQGSSAPLLGGSDGVYSAAKGPHGLPISDKILGALPPATVSSLRATTRGMATLLAAKEEEEENERTALLRRAKREKLALGLGVVNFPLPSLLEKEIEGSGGAWSQRKRPRESLPVADHSHGAKAVSPSASATVSKVPLSHMVETLQAQFAPLSRTAAAKDFSPLHSTVLGNHEWGGSSSTKGNKKRLLGTGGTSLRSSTLLQVVAKDIARHPTTYTALSDALSGPVERRMSHPTTPQINSSPSLLVQIAASTDTSQKELIASDERAQLHKTLSQLSAKETALLALERITSEENISAFYCHDCRLYVFRVADSCKAAKHHVERRKTTKHYVCCGHCGLKTFVLGDHFFHASRVLPLCPRCGGSAKWEQGNAAPEWNHEKRQDEEDAVPSDI